MLATMEDLPNEILGQIFELCVDEDVDMPSRLANSYQSNDYPSAPLDTTKAPWVLSHVSSRWRGLALSSPGLWTAFDINWLDRDDEKDLPYIETLLVLQLERCGNQPLSISWYQISCPKSVHRLLCSKAEQWTNVTLRSERSGIEWFFGFREQFTNITNLHLRFEVHGGDWNGVSQLQEQYGYFFGMFRNTSKLRRLKLSGDYEVMPYIVPEIPWSQLIHFTAVGLSNGSIRESFFGVLPLIENVKICSLKTIPLDEAPSGSFTLAHLHTLTLEQESELDSLLNVLVAPSLRSLNLLGWGLYSFPSLLRLIDRSSCHITHLSIYDIQQHHGCGAFLEFLCAEQLESVEMLEIASSTLVIPEVLDAFHLPQATSTLDDKNGVRVVLPQLQSLVIMDIIDDGDKGSGSGSDDEGSGLELYSSKLVDMLASRTITGAFSAKVSRLKSLTIRGEDDSFHWFKDPDSIARFEELQRNGLLYSHIVQNW
ncbi:hypothetical protein V5O48_009119 [Marasmius crinis-equi]|uniref:F-box domain-containing protein n=1 Tax=Marasmius crinis-equi TaxID=585013 RepID=A0ABR3EQL8_9AGAR